MPAGGFSTPSAAGRSLLNLESVPEAKTGDVLCARERLAVRHGYMSPLFEASGAAEEMIYRCLECGFRFSEAVRSSTDLSGDLLIPDADTSICPACGSRADPFAGGLSVI